MHMFIPLVFLVIGLAFGEITSNTTDIVSTTILPTSTTELSTTVLVSTTTSKSSSITQPPTSTSEVSASTTPETPTTTDVPTTSKPPGPEEGSWNVTDGNVTCIRADMAIEFKVPNVNESIFLSPMATSKRSNCYLTNITQSLVLEYEDYVLAFEFEKDSASTFVRNISFSYITDIFYNDTKLFLVKNGNSYLCKSTEDISIGNATMHIFKIQIQAFGSSNETVFNKAEECELDDSVSDVVPIAVACALAGLIVIVLIAYLIGRRRVRQTGYTSV